MVLNLAHSAWSLVKGEGFAMDASIITADAAATTASRWRGRLIAAATCGFARGRFKREEDAPLPGSARG